jgi:hypothetical protein
MARFQAVLLTLLALLLVSCGDIKENFGTARLRLVHLSPEAGRLSAAIDEKVVASTIDFEVGVPAVNIDGGTRRLVLTSTTTSATLTDSTFGVVRDASYIALTMGYANSYVTLILSETTLTPGSGNFKLRVANAAFGANNIDVYIERAGTDITNATPRISNLVARAAVDFSQYSAGDYEITVTATGTKTVWFSTGRRTFSEGQVFTLVPYTAGSATLLNAALVNADPSQAVEFIGNSRSRSRFVHAGVGAPNLNLTVAAGQTVTNAAYGSSSDYGDAALGSRTVRLAETANPGTILAEGTLSYASARDFSIAAIYPNNRPMLLGLQDSTLLPSFGRSRVRFVNATTDLASVDVFISGTKVVADLKQATGSSYQDLTPEAVTLGVNSVNATTGATLPAITLVTDTVYTIYITGPAANLSAILVKES